MKLFKTTKINQWRNTVSAIKWFNSLKDKHLMKFVMFDIKDFYPSITQDLLNKALNFASEYVYISKSDIDVIRHGRKSFLFDGSHTWIKKQGGLFDASMGAYDGAEMYELVGTYMLNLLSKKYNKNDFGLYGDDGLAVLKNKSGPQSEQVKKNIQKIFKDHGLDIIIQCNMKIVNYLDVTFNLNDGTYKPYTKLNNEIKYIHKNSNHPPSVIRQIPLSIESRLSTISFNEKIFQEAVTPYQKALQNSGYRHTLTNKSPKNDNNSTNINKNKRNRKRQIIWFNPPFNLKTKTKIGKLFLNLLGKHFPPHNKLHRLSNRTNVKISYSCMASMNSYTHMHNHKVLTTNLMKWGLITATAVIKIIVLCQTVVKQNASFTKRTLTVTSLDTNKNVTLAHVKQHLKIVSGIIKSRSTTLNIKMIRNYQKNFGKSKRAMEHQKLHGKLSECVPLTTQTVSAAFYV